MNSTYTISLIDRLLSTLRSSIRLKFQLITFLAMLLSTYGFAQTISIGSPNDATEGSGMPMSFIVSLDNGVINNTGGDITGTITTGGIVTPGADILAPVSFAIPNGSNSIGVLVPVSDDALCEGTETAVFSISNPNVGTVNTAASTTTALLFDDDFCYIISISSSVPSAVEGSSDIVFDVFIEGGQLNSSGSPITGSIGYAGSAGTPADYMPVSTYSIPVGANSTTITVPVVDDAVIENTESLTIFLTGAPSIGSYGNTTTTTTIIDDDAASLSLSIGSPVDGQEGSTFMSYVVSLDNGQVNTTGSAITGSLSYAGTATDGADYAGVASFSIPDGVGSVLVILVVNDDLLVECNETVIATISNPNVGVINPGAASSTANIIDDECVQGGISIGNPIDGAEGGGDVSFEVFLDNGATNATGAPIVGSISYTGTSDLSDVISPPTSFSIPDGANLTIVTISVVDDNLYECDETVIATIANPNVGTIGSASSTATIVDNECAQTTISIVSPSDGAENGSDVSFVITLDNGVINGTGADIVADIAFTGTATAPDDYLDFATVSIPDGFGFSTHVVTVIDDALPEGTESVIATISNPTSNLLVGIAVDTAYILDDDSTTGIELLNAFDLRVFPNPVNANLQLAADEQMIAYSIFDLNGRVVDFGRIDAKEITLSTEYMSAGSYIVEVQFDNGELVRKKILKE